MHAGWRILLTLTLVATAVGALLLRDAPEDVRLPSAYAFVGLEPAGRAYQGDNDDGDNDDGDNDDGDNDDGDDDNDDDDDDDDDEDDDDDDGNGNDNDGDEDEDDFDLCSIYRDLGIPPPSYLVCSPSVAAPARPPEPTCTTPGRDAVFTLHDGKVALRVFGTSPLPVRVVLYQVINADTAPAPRAPSCVPWCTKSRRATAETRCD